MECVVGGEPGDLGVPGQDCAAVEVGQGGYLVVVGTLAEAVERVAGVEFGAVREVEVVIDRDEFALSARRGCRRRRRCSI